MQLTVQLKHGNLRQTDRQRVRETDREWERQTDRQRVRETEPILSVLHTYLHCFCIQMLVLCMCVLNACCYLYCGGMVNKLCVIRLGQLRIHIHTYDHAMRCGIYNRCVCCINLCVDTTVLSGYICICKCHNITYKQKQNQFTESNQSNDWQKQTSL